MSVAETTTPLDAPLASLLHLPPADRLEAIARLAQALKATEATASTGHSSAFPAFIGAWTNNPEAAKMEEAVGATQ